MMRTLLVNIEMEGTPVPVGKISGNDHRDAAFSYASSYLTRDFAKPVSLQLPLQESPFSPDETRRFFEGLLPEGFTRQSVAQWMHADVSDYTEILAGLGRECLGALQILAEGADCPEEHYEPLSLREVRELAAEGATKAAEIVTRTHLSLTGASGKAGLYYEPEEDVWFLPVGSAPSTHIVKQSHVRLQDIVVNEQLSLMTATALGIDVPDSFILAPEKKTTEEILFATARYDRLQTASSKTISGHKRPLRLHQEDFAQALGIASPEKYERSDNHYLRRMFDLIRQYSADPITDVNRLWMRVLFHYLIGNTDAHVKNHSLLYDREMRTIRLAPAYDMISTVIYPESTREMSFYIGGEVHLDRIKRDNLEQAARDAHIGVPMALMKFEEMKNRFESALTESAYSLGALGFPRAQVLRERILSDAQYRMNV